MLQSSIFIPLSPSPVNIFYQKNKTLIINLGIQRTKYCLPISFKLFTQVHLKFVYFNLAVMNLTFQIGRFYLQALND